jgi:hypothetical protein
MCRTRFRAYLARTRREHHEGCVALPDRPSDFSSSVQSKLRRSWISRFYEVRVLERFASLAEPPSAARRAHR